MRSVSASGDERYTVEYIEDEETEDGLNPDFLRPLSAEEAAPARVTKFSVGQKVEARYQVRAHVLIP